MEHILQAHFRKILFRDEKGIALDFGPDLVSILHIGHSSRTMPRRPTLRFLQWLVREIPFDDPNDTAVLVNRSTPDYGVLAVSSRSFAPFISYTCIIKNGRIAYVTLYVSEPKARVFPALHKALGAGKEAEKVFHKHVRAMFSMSADVITKDYSEDAVVITNMAKDICDGKREIHAFCASLMRSSWGILKKIRLHGLPAIRWKTKAIPGGVLLFVCEAKALGMVMTETYFVKDGKIQFEDSIGNGEIVEMIPQMLQ